MGVQDACHVVGRRSGPAGRCRVEHNAGGVLAVLEAVGRGHIEGAAGVVGGWQELLCFVE